MRSLPIKGTPSTPLPEERDVPPTQPHKRTTYTKSTRAVKPTGINANSADQTSTNWTSFHHSRGSTSTGPPSHLKYSLVHNLPQTPTMQSMLTPPQQARQHSPQVPQTNQSLQAHLSPQAAPSRQDRSPHSEARTPLAQQPKETPAINIQSSPVAKAIDAQENQPKENPTEQDMEEHNIGATLQPTEVNFPKLPTSAQKTNTPKLEKIRTHHHPPQGHSYGTIPHPCNRRIQEQEREERRVRESR